LERTAEQAWENFWKSAEAFKQMRAERLAAAAKEPGDVQILFLDETEEQTIQVTVDETVLNERELDKHDSEWRNRSKYCFDQCCAKVFQLLLLPNQRGFHKDEDNLQLAIDGALKRFEKCDFDRRKIEQKVRRMLENVPGSSA
jgi:hypothetical protein